MDRTEPTFPPARHTRYAVPERYREIARLKALGYANKAIAEELGMSEDGISKVLRLEEVQTQLATLQLGRDEATTDITERIQNMCGNAMAYMEKILTDEVEVSASLKFKTAESVLDRAGFGKIQKNLYFGATAHLTGDEVEALKDRARAAGAMI